MDTAIRIALVQIGIGLVAALVWGFCAGAKAMPPAACGGLIGAALTFYSAAKFLGKRGGDAQQVVKNFYSAMARKLLLAIVLFAGAVHLFRYNFAPLITAFASSLAAYWFALLWNQAKDRGM